MASVRLLLSLALLCASATTVLGGRFRWWSPPAKKPRILPILECVIWDGDYYIAHFGYDNQDTTTFNISASDDNDLTLGSSRRSDCATRFVFPNKIPGRPGRTGLYPNTAFNIRLKKGIWGFWRLFGYYLVVTHLGPKCTAPDTIAPRFTSPACSEASPFRYQVPADLNSDSGTIRRLCFTATDNDGTCNLKYQSAGFDDDYACNNCLDNIELPYPFGEKNGSMTATDSAGNAAICPIILNLVDTQAPKVVCAYPLARTSYDVWISDSLATTYTVGADSLKASATDNNQRGYLAFGVNTYSISSPTSRTGNGLDAAGVFAFGTSTVTFTAQDVATPPLGANSGMCQSKVNVGDRAKPLFTVCPVDTITKDADKGTTTATVTIPVSATDTLTKFTITYRRTGVSCSSAAAITSIKGNPKETKTLSITSAFAVGTTTLSVTATDDAGNVATCPITVKVNTAPPNPPFACPAPVTDNTAAGVNTQSISGLRLKGTLTNANYNVTYYSAGVSRVVGAGITIPTTSFNVGVTTITFLGFLKGCKTHSERLASQFTCFFTVTILDAESPKFTTCPADFTISTIAGGRDGDTSTSLVARASDNVGVLVTYMINNVPNTVAATSAAFPLSVNSASIATLPLGTTTVTFLANDDAGNPQATCVVRVTVIDTEAPQIICPRNITRDTDLKAEFATVSDAESSAIATDNVATDTDGILSWTNTTQPLVVTPGGSAGGQYPVGTTINTFIATDTAGNKATCKQVITITERSYCTPLPSGACQNGAKCVTTRGELGRAIGFSCDCSGLGCYAVNVDPEGLCGGSPFPVDNTPSGVIRQSVSRCAPVSIIADAKNCAASTPGVTRAWALVSANPTVATSGFTSTAVSEALITEYLKTVGAGGTVTFGATDLLPGITYTIALVYSEPSEQLPSTISYTLEKSANSTPSVSISGPGARVVLNDAQTMDTYTLQSSLVVTACNTTVAPVGLYTFAWTVSIDGVVTNLGLSSTAERTLSLPIAKLLANPGVYTFQLVVTDSTGNSGLAEYQITFVVVPVDGGSPDPCKSILIQPPKLADATPYVMITTNGATKPVITPSSQSGNRVFGNTITTFDASQFTDPAFCSGSATNGGALEFHWVITYPASSLVPNPYSDQGITGYRQSKLIAQVNSFVNQPNPFTANGAGVQFLLTVYSPNSKMTTTITIQAQVVTSALTLTIFNDCRQRVAACTNNECACTIAAALPTAEPLSVGGGFALMDASDEWVWTWTSSPAMNLSAWGGSTATLTIPTSGMQLGTVYTFQVTVTNGLISGEETTSIYYYNNVPKSDVTEDQQFVVLPPSGAALTQEFLLECHGWSASSVLQYSFKYIPEGGNETDEIGLTSALWVPSTSVYLPAGNITLVAYITSPVDGSYTRTTANVYVSQPSTTARACWVLSIVETIIETAEAQQANSLSLTLVFYLADYLNDPALSASTLSCDGVDKLSELLNLRQRFLAILKRIADSSSLDSNSAAMITSTIMKVVSKIDTTSASASDAAKLLTTVVNGMSSAGASGNSITQTQNNVLSLVSHLVDYIEDCSVLESLSVTVRSMFSLSLGYTSPPGTRTAVLEMTNVQMVATSVWANHPQAAYLGDKLFNFPTAALLTATDSSINVNMVNFAGSQVKKCRATDVRGRAVAVVSDILDVELVSPTTSVVKPVTGLSTPVVFTLPVTTAIASRTCGVGQGSMSCAWWDNTRRGWSTSGCTLVNPSVTLASGETGVQCSCYTVTEVALVRSSITCLDAAHTYGFRVMVVLYGFLLAIAGGLFFRTVRTSHFELRESLVFTLMACISCVVRMVCATHYSQYFALPTGVVDVLMVIPFSILYWINSHFFKQVRVQRYKSTHSQPRWRVEPVLRCVTIGVFLGTLVLLAGVGLDVDSQAQLALVCVRAIALTMLAANTIYFGYSVAIIAGLTSGRSNKHLTRSLVLMSFASLMQSIFWGAWPVSGNSLFPCCGFDLLALGTLLYKYKDPKLDLDNSRASAMFTRAPGVVASDLSITDGDLASPKRGSEFTAPLAAGGPRSSEFAIDSPRRPSTQLAEPPAVEPQA